MKRTISIREMNEKDVPQVCFVEKEIFSTPWSETAFLTSMQQEHTLYLVAEEEETGQVAGYCGFYQSFEDADITNVAVKSEFRRQHIAENMLKYLLELGKIRGIENFTLEVRESNVAAINLYQRLGFESAGIRKDFYEKPKENASIMWKRK